jgi:hypothetical protein
MFCVEVKQGPFDTEDQDARKDLVVRMALDVREATSARNASEDGDTWMRGAPYQQQHRGKHGEDYPFQDAKYQHCSKANHRNEEFVAADTPHVAQFANIDQPLDCHKNDRSEDHVGKNF